MATVTFDTLAYSKALQTAGMPLEQAEALAKAQKAALDEMVAAKELATSCSGPQNALVAASPAAS